MGKYTCKICKKGSFSRSGLTQHVNMIHEGRRTLSQGSFEENQRNIQIPQRSAQDEDLWNTLIFLRQEIVTKFPAKRPKVFPKKRRELNRGS
jgi:hypothetical protein